MVVYKGENVLFIGSLSGFGRLRMESKAQKHPRNGGASIKCDAGHYGATTSQGRCS